MQPTLHIHIMLTPQIHTLHTQLKYCRFYSLQAELHAHSVSLVQKSVSLTSYSSLFISLVSIVVCRPKPFLVNLGERRTWGKERARLSLPSLNWSPSSALWYWYESFSASKPLSDITLGTPLLPKGKEAVGGGFGVRYLRGRDLEFHFSQSVLEDLSLALANCRCICGFFLIFGGDESPSPFCCESPRFSITEPTLAMSFLFH